jgi:hypothetical protein
MSARLKRVRITTRTTATDLVGEATQTYGSAASSSRQGFCHSYQPVGARIGIMFAQLGVALKHQLDLAALLEPLLCKFCRKGQDFRGDLFANITGCIRMLCLAPDALWHNDIDLPTTWTRPTSDPTTTSIWIAASQVSK